VFLSACLRADRAEAQRQLADDPACSIAWRARMPHWFALPRPGGDAVALMLDVGFPIESRGGDGGTALPAAAYAGRTNTVRLLLERGAEIEVRDTTWNSTPIGWTSVGSDYQPDDDPDAS
jgi:hypothetical protein